MTIGKYLALVVFGASLGWLVTEPEWEPLIVFLGSLATVLAMIIRDFREEGGIRRFRGRKHYLQQILKEVQSADRQILMCVHTLTPPSANPSVAELHQILQEKEKEGVKVRILSPSSEMCSQASYALDKAAIEVRHLPALKDRDISFSVFDSVRAVVPTKSGSQEETVEGFTVHSAKLSQLLEKDFFGMWWSHSAMSYESFIRHLVLSAGYDPHATEIKVVSEMLGIPSHETSRILPAYGSNEPLKYIFIIGMPAAGKTTLTASVERFLQSRGAQPDTIYQFNDYSALYERSLEDHRAFECGQRGGFRVKDFSVLDTVLERANTEIRLAQHSHSAFLVEFSRPSYLDAFKVFDRRIMQGSVILYVRCSQETSKRRNEMRTKVSVDRTTGFVPSDVLERYYASDDCDSFEILAKFFGAKIIQIDTDDVSLDELDAYVAQELEAHYNSSGNEDTIMT